MQVPEGLQHLQRRQKGGSEVEGLPAAAFGLPHIAAFQVFKRSPIEFDGRGRGSMILLPGSREFKARNGRLEPIRRLGRFSRLRPDSNLMGESETRSRLEG